MTELRRLGCPRSVGLAVLGAAAVALAGCSDGGPTLHPVTGRVFYEDKPAEGAEVVFVPASGTEPLRPSGVVGKDGSFTMKTYPRGDGAMEGEYTAVVTWYEPTPPAAEDREQPAPKSKLPARYSSPSQSGLKVVVRPGANTLEPFRLTKKSS